MNGINLINLDEGNLVEAILEEISKINNLKGPVAVGVYLLQDPNMEANLYFSSKPFTLVQARDEWGVEI